MSEVDTASAPTDMATDVAQEQVHEQAKVESTVTKVETPVIGDWRQGFSEDLRNNPTLSKYKSVEEAAKALVNQAKLIGKDKVVVPKDGDPQEIIDTFYKANGRPDDPSGYDVEIPESIKLGDEMKEAYFGKFHSLGLNKAQVEGLLAMRAEELSINEARKIADSEKMFNKGIVSLRKELGADFDNQMAMAKNVVKNLFGEELVGVFRDNKLDNDPRVVKAAMKIAKAIGNDKFINNDTVDMTPNKAHDEITRIKSGAAYWDAMHPEHDSAVERVQNLLEYT